MYPVQFIKTPNAPRGASLCDIIGFIKLDKNDPRSAAEQYNTAYAGGWRPLEGFLQDGNYNINYPGDPTMKPWAVGRLRTEIICVYKSAWFAVFQLNGSFEVCRMD